MDIYYFYHLQTNIAAYQEEREEADREVVQQPIDSGYNSDMIVYVLFWVLSF